jgi:hypothetical protein
MIQQKPFYIFQKGVFQMKRKVTIIIAMATTLLFLAGGMSFAGYGKGNGAGKGSGTCQGDQKRDRLKDGSCQKLLSTESNASPLAAAKTQNRTKTKSQKKDGSCLTTSSLDDASMMIAKDQIRKKDQIKKKDGSCISLIQSNNSETLLAAGQHGKRGGDKDGTQDRDQDRDGSY